MINVGIIGTASIANISHAPSLHEVDSAQVWSFLRRDPNRALTVKQ